MTATGPLRLATRGSDLALRQAAGVREALADRHRDAELVEVETRGDQLQDELIHRLGRTGAFVRSLDERVLAGEVDAAVHSMKDMPTELPPDLVVAAVPERAPAGDVLVSPDGVDVDGLPEGATVGTSSLRRRAQLLRARPDLAVEPLRGNVDTRLEKLLAPSLQREHERRLDAEAGAGDAEDGGDGGDGSEDDQPEYDRDPEEWFEDLSELERQALGRAVETEYDAVVLAEAGLRRSGLLERVPTQRLPRSEFVPAPGQGAIAVTASDPAVAATLREVLDHPRTRVATTVERTVLGELGGGCVAPIGVHALLQGEYVHVEVQVLSGDGDTVVGASRDLPLERYYPAAVDLAAELREDGAAEVIERARRDADADDGASEATDGGNGA